MLLIKISCIKLFLYIIVYQVISSFFYLFFQLPIEYSDIQSTPKKSRLITIPLDCLTKQQACRKMVITRRFGKVCWNSIMLHIYLMA